ncbi:MAG: clostripain-related cysteine peptidase, partial [Spirochaetota bacterium]|nr:clostripain-related cysteine peptidase [Spirochaetota bacterium]
TNTVVLLYMPSDYEGGNYIESDIYEIIQASIDLNPSTMRIVSIADYPYDNNTQLFESIYGYRRDIPLTTAGFTGNELNTASSSNISQLLSFINSNYRPQQIVLMLLDRKPKPLWCVAEDATSASTLTIHDFAQTIKNNNISVLVLDAPVKSTVEVAYELRNSKTGIEYFIASQGEVLAGGFQYTALLNGVYQCITSEPPPVNMALAIAESICSTTAYPLPAGQIDIRSLALIDLQQIEIAVSSMNAIVSECQNVYTANPLTIDAARFSAHFYYSIPWYADLVEFLQTTENTQLLDAANNFANCVCKKVMPYNNTHSGLSLMFSTMTHEEWYINNTCNLDFVSSYGWDEFLQNKHFGLYYDPYEMVNNEPGSHKVMLIDGNSDGETVSAQNYFHDPYDRDMYTIAVNEPGAIYKLTAHTVVTLNNNNDRWQSITISQDGTKLAAAVYDGYIFTSGDGGTTWVQRNTPKSWTSITGSQDGTKLAATVYGGYIYTSSDSGVTWSQRAGQKSWISVACSQDGLKMAAAAYNDYIYISTSGGNSWTSIANPGQKKWAGVAMAYDGMQIAAISNDGIYIITNQSGSWVASDIYGVSASWVSIAGCGKGNDFIIVAAQYPGYIYLSKVVNGTRIWTCLTQGGRRNWKSVSISPDSTRIIAIADNTIFESVDQGQTWYVRDDAGMHRWNFVTYAWNQNALALVSSPANSAVNGLLTVAVNNVPENCEYIVRIADDNGNILNESDRSGPGGTITLQQCIQTDVIRQYFISLIPVNVSGWSMNTKEQYTVQFNYQKN